IRNPAATSQLDWIHHTLSADRCTHARFPDRDVLLRDRHYSGDVYAPDRDRFAISWRIHGFQGRVSRWRQDLQDHDSAEHPSRKVLVLHGVRQPNTVNAGHSPAFPSRW